MKTYTILIFFALFTFYACSDNLQSRLSKDPIVSAVFEEKEIEQLIKIHKLFFDEIRATQNMDPESTVDLLVNYLEIIRENPDARGNLYPLIKIDEEKRQNLISELELSCIFDELFIWDTTWWDRERMRYSGMRETDSIANVRIEIKYDGKYPQFMSELANQDTIIRKHYEIFTLAGGLTNFHFYDMVFEFEKYNLELERIQLYYAISFFEIGVPLYIPKH